MVGVAVNVTISSEQMVVADAAMLTDGATFAFTVTVNEQFVVGELLSA